jgi:hypothetical protein
MTFEKPTALDACFIIRAHAGLGKAPLDGVDNEPDTGSILGFSELEIPVWSELTATRRAQVVDRFAALGVVYRLKEAPGWSINYAVIEPPHTSRSLYVSKAAIVGALQRSIEHENLLSRNGIISFWEYAVGRQIAVKDAKPEINEHVAGGNLITFEHLDKFVIPKVLLDEQFEPIAVSHPPLQKAIRAYQAANVNNWAALTYLTGPIWVEGQTSLELLTSSDEQKSDFALSICMSQCDRARGLK